MFSPAAAAVVVDEAAVAVSAAAEVRVWAAVGMAAAYLVLPPSVGRRLQRGPLRDP